MNNQNNMMNNQNNMNYMMNQNNMMNNQNNMNYMMIQNNMNNMINNNNLMNHGNANNMVNQSNMMQFGNNLDNNQSQNFEEDEILKIIFKRDRDQKEKYIVVLCKNSELLSEVIKRYCHKTMQKKEDLIF